MTEQEFKAQMEKVYAFNRKRKQDEQKLTAIREALSSLTAKPKLSDMLEFLRKIREVL